MPYLDVEAVDEATVRVRARYSAVFSNWILFRRHLVRLGLEQDRNLVLDLSATKVVDHNVMEKLHQLESDFEDAGLRLEVIGLETHRQASEHPYATRRRVLTRLRRVTIVAGSELEPELTAKIVELGASGFTSIACSGAGRTTLGAGNSRAIPQIRIETVVSAEVAERILDHIHRNLSPKHPITAVLETVEALRRDQF
jgi:MFS superfamily sulfate permease-like transporter